MGKIYALIYEGRVKEIIQSNGIFEDIPLEQRYTKEIVDQCVECNEDIKEGMDYNWDTNEFTVHIDPIIEPDVDIIEEEIEEEVGNGEYEIEENTITGENKE